MSHQHVYDEPEPQERADCEEGEYDAAILAGPVPSRLKCETVIDGLNPVTTLSFHRINPAVVMLIPFTCFWSGGSMYMIYVRQFMEHKFDLTGSLFGLPFLIGTIALLCIIAFMLFGKEVVTLSRGQGKDFTGVGPFGRTKRFTYDRNTRLTLYEGRAGLIELKNPGKVGTTRICRNFDEDAREYAAAVLRREFAR